MPILHFKNRYIVLVRQVNLDEVDRVQNYQWGVNGENLEILVTRVRQHELTILLEGGKLRLILFYDI